MIFEIYSIEFLTQQTLQNVDAINTFYSELNRSAASTVVTDIITTLVVPLATLSSCT